VIDNHQDKKWLGLGTWLKEKDGIVVIVGIWLKSWGGDNAKAGKSLKRGVEKKVLKGKGGGGNV